MSTTIQQLNDRILNNPQILQALFEKIFGKYMTQYYGERTRGYTVHFGSTSNGTSYCDSTNKRIQIDLVNIKQQLERGISPFAVAYHELAHVLYTNDYVRDAIRDKVVAKVYVATQMGETYSLTSQINQIAHHVWNVLEDERIERKMMREFPFLRVHVDPLKRIIEDDGHLFSWRLGKYAQQQAPKAIVLLAETFVNDEVDPLNVKTKSHGHIKRCVEAITPIVIDLLQQQQQPPQPPRTKGGNKPTKIDFDEPVDDDNDNDNEDEDNDDNKTGGDFPTKRVSKPANKQDDDDSKQQSKEQRVQEQRMIETLEKELDKIVETIQTQVQEAEYEKSLAEAHLRDIVITKKYPFLNEFSYKIPVFNSQKSIVRGGMTLAQMKSYKSDISSKLNTTRLVQAIANRQEPKVFYNKGKDMQALRKVVIFHDVSGSTANDIDGIFDIVALSLAKSFEQVDWWVYGDALWKKHVEDYEMPTMLVGSHYRIDGSTRTTYLANVMRKYQKENAIFVVLTDGDIQSLVIGNPMWEKFKDKTAFIGYLDMSDDEMKQAVKHHATISHDDYVYVKHGMSRIFYDNDVCADIARETHKLQSLGMATIDANRVVVKKYQYKLFLSDDRIRKMITHLQNSVVSLVKGIIK